MNLWAHSRSGVSGRRHGLAEHCRSTAEWASRFASVFGVGELAYAVGLFHDAGKASCAWQDRLAVVDGTDAPVGVPHKVFGAHLLAPTVGSYAMTIAGHHGGLTNVSELRDQLSKAAAESDWETAQRFWRAVPEASAVLSGRKLVPPTWAGKPSTLMEMRIRMLFSALVDADHLDTGAHRAGLAGPRVAGAADMSALVDRFERGRQQVVSSSVSGIGGLRDEVYRAAVAAAGRESGVFRLAAPTGLGKTFAQAGFGLHHAMAQGRSRVVIAVPFITITEQNAAVYRRILDTEDEHVVLEHHSSVRYREDDDPQTDGAGHERWARLAAENWDAPFVVTTTVQLFESLFGRKPSQIRKLHRLTNAVLILDEVQALPTRLLLPILDGLRLLAEQFNTTVLLTSATQPEFEALSVWNTHATSGTGLPIRDIIDDPQSLFDRARRVRYQWRLDPKPTWEQVAVEVGQCEQVLVVVNSIADAGELYRLLSERRDDVWHLSTLLCPHHRRTALAMITERLAAGLPTLVVSTPLIEAGVDISFPRVWRALAPADSLQQAGGRANRGGECRDGGLVVIFDPADGRAPADYATPSRLAVECFGPDGPKLDDQHALGGYYRRLYESLGLDNRTINRRKEPVGQVIQRNRAALDFVAVTDGPQGDRGRDATLAFRMITDDTVPIVVVDDNHATEIGGWLAELAAGTEHSRRALRALQPWIVQLRRHTATRPDIAAMIDPVVGDLGRWKGTYCWNEDTRQGTGLDLTTTQTVF
ncbi:CRISPR-associated endonuclease Cas3'' [Nocardia salmonicida]|uniref:CRISPR-associated endonuclease Cas3'' n=1 Tax=Nocardia salmonicida TaxID=53431 RepID=UPI003CE74190